MINIKELGLQMIWTILTLITVLQLISAGMPSVWEGLRGETHLWLVNHTLKRPLYIKSDCN